METLYYVKPREEELGPLTFAQLRSMWSRGEITVKTPFRFEEEENWQTLAVLRRELESGGPPPLSQAPPALPGVNQAPAQPSPKRSNVGGCGCLVLLLVGIAVFTLSNRGPSAEEEAATAKRLRDQDSAISASLRQEVANAKTTQEKLRAVEKLLKHEPGNLDAQTALKNLSAGSQKQNAIQADKTINLPNATASEEPNGKNWREYQIKGQEWFGASSRELFEKLVKFAVQKDSIAFGKLMTAGLQSGETTMFKEGERVLLMDTAVFSGLVKVRRAGELEEFWTNFEAIK